MSVGSIWLEIFPKMSKYLLQAAKYNPNTITSPQCEYRRKNYNHLTLTFKVNLKKDLAVIKSPPKKTQITKQKTTSYQSVTVCTVHWNDKKKPQWKWAVGSATLVTVKGTTRWTQLQYSSMYVCVCVRACPSSDNTQTFTPSVLMPCLSKISFVFVLHLHLL